jgi:hypothetical protein
MVSENISNIKYQYPIKKKIHEVRQGVKKKGDLPRNSQYATNSFVVVQWEDVERPNELSSFRHTAYGNTGPGENTTCGNDCCTTRSCEEASSARNANGAEGRTNTKPNNRCKETSREANYKTATYE